MRHLINIINESVTEDVSDNMIIDSALSQLTGDDKVVAYDIVEIIYNHKSISKQQLISQVQDIHPTYGNTINIINDTVRFLPQFLLNDNDGYHWKRAKPTTDSNIDQGLQNAATQQIQIIHTVLSHITSLESFTEQDVTECLYDMGLPTQMADMFTNHVMDHFINMATKNPDGSYSMPQRVQKKAQDYINDWTKKGI